MYALLTRSLHHLAHPFTRWTLPLVTMTIFLSISCALSPFFHAIRHIIIIIIIIIMPFINTIYNYLSSSCAIFMPCHIIFKFIQSCKIVFAVGIPYLACTFVYLNCKFVNQLVYFLPFCCFHTVILFLLYDIAL